MENYSELEQLFMEAVKASNEGRDNDALQLFRDILKQEPRMAECRIEVATLLFKQGDLETAEAEAQEGIEYLERGWRWLENLTEEQMLAHAYNLLGEILKEQSLSDAALRKGDAYVRELWARAGEVFEKAAENDPDNPAVMANYYGFKKARRPTRSF